MKDNLITLKQLDRQLISLKEKDAYLVPKQGWVRTIRKALGMTIKQLAKRMKVHPSRVVKIESSELDGALTLRTLQSVAESLGCTFVYSFVPKLSLEAMVKQRAKKVATEQVKRAAHSMNLEAQSVEQKWLDEQILDETDELLRKSWRQLWKD